MKTQNIEIGVDDLISTDDFNSRPSFVTDLIGFKQAAAIIVKNRISDDRSQLSGKVYSEHLFSMNSL